MNYDETIQYLFNSAPLFQHIGKGAYKEGLYNTKCFDSHFGHPHQEFKTIHIAGTNGKGSCAHTIAAILQSCGYKVGLYTSPHLVDFRERIRINGKMIDKNFIVDFVEREKAYFEQYHPSFFELATALAFHYFALNKIDVAVVEVGLGGRLDCTNIISPDLSIITNISLDHTQFLGDTLAKIAYEKAGIIKAHTPVVIGEAVEETRPVFKQKAEEMEAPIYFAEENPMITHSSISEQAYRHYETCSYGIIEGELMGDCQEKNSNTILTAIGILKSKGYNITDEAIKTGFRQVCELTGLMGRWQQLSTNPIVVCDTGHNVGGWQYLSARLKSIQCRTLRIVFGMVNDKDINGVLALMPSDAEFYFAKASVQRALNENELQEQAMQYGLRGKCFTSVAAAYEQAMSDAEADDFIFVGGSSFVVADLLRYKLKH